MAARPADADRVGEKRHREEPSLDLTNEDIKAAKLEWANGIDARALAPTDAGAPPPFLTSKMRGLRLGSPFVSGFSGSRIWCGWVLTRSKVDGNALHTQHENDPTVNPGEPELDLLSFRV